MLAVGAGPAEDNAGTTALAGLKAQLKAWEKAFFRAHGRKPGAKDIDADPAVARQYKAYSAAKSGARGGKSTSRGSRPEETGGATAATPTDAEGAGSAVPERTRPTGTFVLDRAKMPRKRKRSHAPLHRDFGRGSGGPGATAVPTARAGTVNTENTEERDRGEVTRRRITVPGGHRPTKPTTWYGTDPDGGLAGSSAQTSTELTLKGGCSVLSRGGFQPACPPSPPRHSGLPTWGEDNHEAFPGAPPAVTSRVVKDRAVAAAGDASEQGRSAEWEHPLGDAGHGEESRPGHKRSTSRSHPESRGEDDGDDGGAWTPMDEDERGAPSPSNPTTNATRDESAETDDVTTVRQPLPDRQPSGLGGGSRAGGGRRGGAMSAPMARRGPGRKPVPAEAGGNFKRLYLQKAGGGYRRGARPKFSKAYKKNNHRNAVARRGTCFSCGQEGHFASDCPDKGLLEPPDRATAAASSAEGAGPSGRDSAARKGGAGSDGRKWTVKTLQSELRQRGLPISGKKDELLTRLQTARAEGTTTEGSLASPVPPSTDMEEDEFAFDSDDFDEPAPNTSAAGDTAATAVGPSHDESEDDASLCAALDEYERTAPALDMTVAALADDENPWPSNELLVGWGTNQLKRMKFTLNDWQVLKGRSSLVILPTGAGKSLCYQLPAYIFGKQRAGLMLVISPLVSLIDDQVLRLPKGLVGATLNSSMTPRQKDKVWERFSTLNVLFVAPETATSAHFLHTVAKQNCTIAAACIDEVHCVSEWSHNFRTAYLRLPFVLRAKLGVQCLLGLTATATVTTERSIVEHLGIPAESVIRAAPIPENLILTVARPADRREELVHLLKHHHQFSKGAAIVYAMRQADTEALASMLRTCDVDADAYHAGLTSPARRKVQRRFMTGACRVVVATIAFGMGLDKADVRVIVHYHMPKSAENYVQEVGRAGRDGGKSYCRVFLDDEDRQILRRFAYTDSVDRHTVQKLMRSVFRDKEAHCAVVAACREAVRTTANGETLVTQAATAPRRVLIPQEKVAYELDVGENFVGTVLSALEIHPEQYVEQKWGQYATVKLTIFDEAVASRDSLVVAARAGKAWKSGVVEVQALASALGLEPRQVLQAFNGLQKSGVLRAEFSDMAYNLEVKHVPDSDEFDAIHAELCTTLELLEATQLNKIEFIHAAYADAFAVKPQEDGGGPSRTQLMNTLIRNRLAKYFVGAVDLGAKPVVAPLAPALVEQIRSDTRSLLTNIPRLEWPSSRGIARIFHGIPSPRYPFRMWASHRAWKRHELVEFNRLREAAAAEIRAQQLR